MMSGYKPPLSVIFVWHPADALSVESIVDYCYSLLSRDVNKPFSRSMNLPVFFYTTLKKGVPPNIKILSEKTVIFIFLSKEVVADYSWKGYLENIPRLENVSIIPIALDETAYFLNHIFDYKNFIRLADFDMSHLYDYFFIAITHEIYRWALNDFLDLEKDTSCNNNALKLFLSHAKEGEVGLKIARALKGFIDNSNMNNFFDATDIAPGYKFDDEIIKNIKRSTVIAIHTDPYSSRYWCQREILCAKEHNRPIVAVDTLEEFEDRRFPFASNIPGIHLHPAGEPTKKDLLRILRVALLETVRYYYAKMLLQEFRTSGIIDSQQEICPRPPEVADIGKVFDYDGKAIKVKKEYLVYPEPPLYNEEISFLCNLGVKINTPLSLALCPLEQKSIGISISEISAEELHKIGQRKNHLTQLSQEIARYLLANGAILIYGGDLRENGFTSFIFDEAQALQARMQSNKAHIKNYLAWPIYIKDTLDVKNWKARYRSVAEMIEIPPPADVKQLIPDEECFLPLTNTQNHFVWSRCLTEMRNRMISDCDVRICAGGKHSGYQGKMPGVLEEIIIALKNKSPLYLMGGFGGVTASICNLLENKNVPVELTKDWQVNYNIGYKDLLNKYENLAGYEPVNYNNIVGSIKNAELNNGLNPADNQVLFNTPVLEEALFLIFKGLKNLFAEKKAIATTRGWNC